MANATISFKNDDQFSHSLVATITINWYADEELSDVIAEPTNGWLSSVKTLKNGARRMSRKLTGSDRADLVARATRWMNVTMNQAGTVTVK